jgi:glycerol kinase
LIAECAFNPGDCVITVGTGSFISVNIGNRPISSQFGSYPLAGFKHKDKQMYILHSPASAAGLAINWAKSLGKLINKVFFLPSIVIEILIILIKKSRPFQ